MGNPLPYQIAVLCYLFDERGRVLLLHRRKPPNRDLYSPIGGKLEQPLGESPTVCAIREIREETGLIVEAGELHLTGIVSETGYEGQSHWLMFMYELARVVAVEPVRFDEGSLDWHGQDEIAGLPIPETDSRYLWPLFRRYRGRFFMAHIDCLGSEMACRVEQPRSDAGAFRAD